MELSLYDPGPSKLLIYEMDEEDIILQICKLVEKCRKIPFAFVKWDDGKKLQNSTMYRYPLQPNQITQRDFYFRIKQAIVEPGFVNKDGSDRYYLNVHIITGKQALYFSFLKFLLSTIFYDAPHKDKDSYDVVIEFPVGQSNIYYDLKSENDEWKNCYVYSTDSEGKDVKISLNDFKQLNSKYYSNFILQCSHVLKATAKYKIKMTVIAVKILDKIDPRVCFEKA